MTTTVWDGVTRTLHWGLAGSSLAALGTGFLAPEWWLPWHVAAGAVAGTAVAGRGIWGLFGPGPARFGAFVLHPRAVWHHVVSAARREPRAHYGHPPAGALMAVLLLVVVAALGVSGLVAHGGREDLGPLHGVVGGAAGAGAARVHAWLAWGLLALVAGHLAGVAAESALSRDNLVRAMITGRRANAPAPGPAERRPARPRAALAAATGLAIVAAPFAVGHPVTAGRAVSPTHSAAVAPTDPAYKKACDDCHMAYPPGLLPAESWRRLMANLDDHFGENAFLMPGTKEKVRRYLTANAAGTADTEAARHFRHVDPAAPLAVTETPYWRRRHAGIAKARFKAAPVKAKSNCKACHRDATSGWFRDAAIDPPAAGGGPPRKQ
mgnify:CR=1 FL=1